MESDNMAGYNNGKTWDFNDIKNYDQAARDFAEGNKDLEYLLYNCFSKGIKTHACCSDGKMKPYISFLYTEENMPYLYAILSELKDKGYTFQYSQSPSFPKMFSIQEKDTYDFQKATSLFHEIDQIICNFNPHKNYYGDLPTDLQEYINIINIAKNYSFRILKENTNIRILGEGFKFGYEKKEEGYEYALSTRDYGYNKFAESSSFKKIDMGWKSYYSLQVEKREEAFSSLYKLACYTKAYVGLKNSENEISFSSEKIIAETEKQIKEKEYETQLLANIDIETINKIYEEEQQRKH